MTTQIKSVALQILSDDELEKLEQVTNSPQRELILSAILRGENVPDYAWQDLPKLPSELSHQFSNIPPLTELVPNLPDDNELLELDWKVLEEFVMNLCLVLGRHGHPEALDEAHRLLAFSLDQGYADDFKDLERKVLEELVIPETASGFALMPFLLASDDSATTASLSIDLAVTLPAPIRPLQGVGRMLEIAGRGWIDHSARIYQGLLLLGDRRVNTLLRDVLTELEDEEKEMLAGAKSGQIFAATVDFKLDWLEELLRDGNAALTRTNRKLEAGILLSLLSAPSQCEDGLVHEIERDLPLAGPESSGLRIVRSWTLKEFSEHLAARLAPLSERMSDPAFATTVLAAWGVESVREPMDSIVARTRLETLAFTGNSGFLVQELEGKSIVYGKMWWIDEPDNWAYVPEKWAWDAWHYYRARAKAKTWGEFLAGTGEYGRWVLEWYNEHLRNWERAYQVDEHDAFDADAIAEQEWDWELGPISIQGAMEAYLPEEVLDLAVIRESNVHGDRFVEFDAGDHGVILGRLRELGYSVREDQDLIYGSLCSEGETDPEEHAEKCEVTTAA